MLNAIQGITNVGAAIGAGLGVNASGTAASGSSFDTGSSGGVFGGLLHSATQQINKLENDAQTATVGLLSGTGVEVHDVMIATQKADLAFQLALQVRNKAVAAYQQMMQMQF